MTDHDDWVDPDDAFATDDDPQPYRPANRNAAAVSSHRTSPLVIVGIVLGCLFSGSSG